MHHFWNKKHIVCESIDLPRYWCHQDIDNRRSDLFDLKFETFPLRRICR
jgi:hypothetical protein